jgi:hypothetical protein
MISLETAANSICPKYFSMVGAMNPINRAGGRGMEYLKCAVAGILTVIAVLVLFPLIVMIVTVPFTVHRSSGFGMEIPRWHVHSPYFWIVIGVAFAIGFSWQQRRLSK